MFVKTRVQSRPWRFFALGIVAFVALPLLRAHSATEWLRSAAGAFALIGLAGYAFGYRVGPLLFWRAFAIWFALAATIRFGAIAVRSFPPTAFSSDHGPHGPIVLVVGFALLTLVILALFRHSELTRGHLGNGTEETAEPLFQSPETKWERIAQVTAEARTELERPMTPEMQAEALSFGPRRQLSLREAQHIGTIMLAGTAAAQAAMAVAYGGRIAILVPAAALAIGAAIAAHFSAEMILKGQERFAKTSKAMALLLFFAVLALFLDKPGSIRLWMARAGAWDCLALCSGGWLITAGRLLRQGPRG